MSKVVFAVIIISLCFGACRKDAAKPQHDAPPILIVSNSDKSNEQYSFSDQEKGNEYIELLDISITE